MPIGLKGFQKGHKQFNSGKTWFKKGVPYNKGKKFPQLRGEKNPAKRPEVRKKISIANKGKKFRLGQKNTEEHKRKIGKALKGRIAIWAKPPHFTGEKSSNWKGGVSKRKDYQRFLNHQRRVRKLGNGGGHTLGEWETLKAQYGFICPRCKQSEPKIKLTEDHIIPISKGGSDNIENIQPLCFSCNSWKHTKIIKYEL